MARAMGLPSGTVTLWFSDIEGSTRLLEHLGERYDEVLAEHHRIVREAVARHGGHEVRTEGDAFFVAFTRAGDAVRAAVDVQRGLAACCWPHAAAVRVRMGMHTGEPRVVAGDYVGIDVHCAARICSAAHGGQVVISEATERVLANQHVDDVGIRDLGEHRLKDLSRPLRLYQVAADGLSARFPPLRALERPPMDGPEQWAAPTTLFGREDDIEELARLLGERRCRVVTLVGPGGVGKTRLAIAAAARVASDFADGTRFVRLASVFEPRELASAIGQALAAPIREGESSYAATVRIVSDRHLLLVLDNFEQLVDAASLVSDLLSACPGLTVLITSRQPARLTAERVFPVAPLAVPDVSAAAAAIELERYAAVAMFMDRARAHDPDFAIDDSNATVVREICRRLDGLPLALELAAARVGLLTASELFARLDDALGVLIGGARDAPDRQRTLRATLDWSFRLLDDGEREAFARMAVFPAGAAVGVAEAVIATSLETLEALVAKQLLVRRDERLMMLETVREYALERLAADPEADSVRIRVAEWCRRFARETTPSLRGDDRTSAIVKLETELPNLLAVLTWAVTQRRAEMALLLLRDWADYWWNTNRWQEGRAWLDTALEQATDAPDRARAGALLYRARLADLHYCSEEIRADYEASLRLFRASHDAAGAAACLAHLAWVELWHGNVERATEDADEAIRIAQRTQDDSLLAFVLAMSALARTGYTARADRADLAVAKLRAVGDLVGVVHVCGNVAYMAIAERRYPEALRLLQTAFDAARRLGDPNAVFMIRTNEGLAQLFLDQLDAAASAFCDALAICRDAGAEDVVDETLLGLASVEASRGDFDRAARLAGGAIAHQTAERNVEEDTIWSQLLETLNDAREHCGHATWDRAASEGATLTVHETIDLALAHGRFAPPPPATLAALPR
jgi:predicted ATPase/class 3 adenylate cyclase